MGSKNRKKSSERGITSEKSIGGISRKLCIWQGKGGNWGACSGTLATDGGKAKGALLHRKIRKVHTARCREQKKYYFKREKSTKKNQKLRKRHNREKMSKIQSARGGPRRNRREEKKKSSFGR